MTETREGTDVVERDDVLSTLAEWHNTLRQWSGSAFIAGEDIGDTDGAREQLYVDLCRLGNETAWMEERVARLRAENEALKEALRDLPLPPSPIPSPSDQKDGGGNG
jgi:hypothetical protein